MDPAGRGGRSHLRANRLTAEALPTWLFGAYVAVAGPVLLFHFGAYHWFHRDEWAFLTSTRSDPFGGLYHPHGGSHWVAVPRLIYLLLWELVGVTTYRPYQMVVIATHLAVVILIHRVMRAAGVRPWLAFAAAAVLVLSGPGETNTVWAFQMTINASLAFGLGHLLLAHHDGPPGRRDLLGLACGLLAITSSGVGVTMVVAVATTVLLRRGWRIALLHGLPLAVVYGAWAVLAGASTPGRESPALPVVYGWVRSSFVGTFAALGRFSLLAWLLVAVLAAGLAIACGPWRGSARRDVASMLAMPIGLCTAALFFASTTALGRAGPREDLARSDRYLYILAALVLPLVVAAAEVIAHRWRTMTPALVALFLLPIPFNLRDFDRTIFGADFMKEREYVLTTAVRMPFARDVPSDVQPAIDPASWGVTIGFLLAAEADGKLIPSSIPLTPRMTNEFRIRLGVAQRIADDPETTCRTYSAPIDLAPAIGDTFYLGSPIEVLTQEGGRGTSRAVGFAPGLSGRQLTIELPDLQLRIRPSLGAPSFTLCQEAET